MKRVKKWLSIASVVTLMALGFMFVAPTQKASAAGPVYLNGANTAYKTIYVSSPYQKINFYAVNLTYLDVKVWVKNITTGGTLYGPVMLYSEGSQIGPRSYPYTNLKSGFYRIHLQGYSYFSSAKGDIYFVY